MDYYNYVIYKPTGNHKENTYQRYTEENEKGIKACYNKTISSTREDSRDRMRVQVTTRQKIINKMAIVSPSLPIITVNVSGLNSTIKRHTKNKIQLYTVYSNRLKRLTLDLRAHIR